jgi:IMP dehydrogenase/GMP reductase
MTGEGSGTADDHGRAARQRARPLDRATAFCARYRLACPILLAPMAAACPPSLSIAVANAGGMGAMGALASTPAGIRRGLRQMSAIRTLFAGRERAPDLPTV